MLLTGPHPIAFDRRTSCAYPGGQYSPGIARIERLAATEVEKHDEMYFDYDTDEWQTTYSLLNHQAKVGSVMEKIGRACNWSEDDIQLGRVAGLLHDMGKLRPECAQYRSKKKLSPENRELLTELHSDFSYEFGESLMPKVRAEDRIFLGRILPLLKDHHKPHRIYDSTVRRIGYKLMTSDVFVSIQEDRERPGLSLPAALDFIEVWDPCERDKEHERYPDLIAGSKRVILWLFDLKGTDNPLVI